MTPKLHLFGCLTVLLASARWAALADEPLSLAPRKGVVLLANGEMISGTIIPAGDRYDVHLESGEISLRKSNVALVCESAEECYRHKRAGIDPGRAQDHLDLAEWCVRHKLFAAAERELADARRADDKHPRIRLVASRLELARQPAPPPAEPSTRVVAHNPLENVSRHLPPGTMETFTNTIQPLLLNNCSKSGCHASRDDGGFKLERIHPRFPSRTATQRNMQQVLSLVNHDNPPASKLLQTPIRPHAGVGAPIFTDRKQGQYLQLVQWVYAISGSRTPSQPPSFDERTAPLLQTVPGATGANAGSAPGEAPATFDPAELPPADALNSLPQDDPPVDGMQPQATPSQQAYTPEQLRAMGLDVNGQPLPGGRVTPRGQQLLSGESSVQRGAKLPAGFTPRDEFDPEIFNRQFFGN